MGGYSRKRRILSLKKSQGRLGWIQEGVSRGTLGPRVKQG